MFVLYFFRAQGEAFTILTRKDWRSAKELIEILEEAEQVCNDSSFYVLPHTNNNDNICVLICARTNGLFIGALHN